MTEAPTPDRRPPDAVREMIIARLSTAFAQDHLTLEEFERRVEAVYQAGSASALALLVNDLPAVVTAEPGAAAVAPPTPPLPPRISALLGSVERGGRMVIPARLQIRALFANVELDLRQAEFQQGVTEIAVRALFSNVEVRLPAGVAVEHHGSAALGVFAARKSRVLLPVTAASKRLVRVLGRALFSNVEFWEGEPTSGSDA